MKLHFDSNQQYQWDALKAITDIFEGQPLSSGDFEFSTSNIGALFSENGFGNNLTLSAEQILENVKSIQQRNEIINTVEELKGMNFSIEMETGTGRNAS
jgi:type III restriction enzyme